MIDDVEEPQALVEIGPHTGLAAEGTDGAEKRKEMALETPVNTPKEIVRQEIVYRERPARKITEIRIFFDDNTFEIFKPEN